MKTIECVSIDDLKKQYVKYCRCINRLNKKFNLTEEQQNVIDEMTEDFNELYYLDEFCL